MNENRITLEELAQKPYPIIFDTCIFIFGNTKDRIKGCSDLKRKEYLNIIDRESNFFVSFQNFIKNGGNFYICSSVRKARQFTGADQYRGYVVRTFVYRLVLLFLYKIEVSA